MNIIAVKTIFLSSIDVSHPLLVQFHVLVHRDSIAIAGCGSDIRHSILGYEWNRLEK